VSSTSRPRVLFLGNVFPVPADDGTKIRIRNLVEAVATVADVDVFTLYGPDDPLGTAADLGVARLGGVPRNRAWRPRSPLRWPASSLPRPWASRDVSAAREALSAFTRGSYDLVWYCRVETFLTFGPVPASRRLLDVDVLEGERIATSVEAGKGSPLRTFAAFVDRARWRRLERRVVDAVDVAFVCSDADRRRLGGDGVVVVPNGYEEARSLPAVTSEHPTVGFVGSFAYGPNVDAARVLVEDVMPRVRARVPQARLLLVGRRGDELFGVDRPDWVEATGYVDEVEPWLARIDVMAVPIRYGGGTRIKILEALCHRIPLAAYRYAVAGIDVADGVHAHLVEDAEGLAAAVVALLEDADAAARLAEAGRRLFEERYRWGAIRTQVAGLVADLVQR